MHDRCVATRSGEHRIDTRARNSRVAGSTNRLPRAPSRSKKRGEFRTLRSALFARRRVAGGTVAVVARFGRGVVGRDVWTTLFFGVAARVCGGRSRAGRAVVGFGVAALAWGGRLRAGRAVVPMLVLPRAVVATPPPCVSGSSLGASRVVDSRATVARITAAPAAAPAAAQSGKARPRPGRVAAAATAATGSSRVGRRRGSAARGAAVGNVRACASASSRNSGETRTSSGLSAFAESSVDGV